MGELHRVGGHSNQEGPLDPETLLVLLDRGGGPQPWRVSVQRSGQIASAVVISLIQGFACVIPMN